MFLCIHNSARSQMAEAYLNKMSHGKVIAESAGFDIKEINPLAIEVMKEDGIDISANSVNEVFEFVREGKFFGYVITVCDRAAAMNCPTFPGIHQRFHWDIEDPEEFEGTYEQKLEKTRQARDDIKKKSVCIS